RRLRSRRITAISGCATRATHPPTSSSGRGRSWKRLPTAGKYSSISSTKRPERARSSRACCWMLSAAPRWTLREGRHELQCHPDECLHFRQPVFATDIHEVEGPALLGPPLRQDR